ncbi:hypothetical protein P154DRAFT_457349 [Amniculicola lignicola CBS 123094]|uniref:Macro domain-containing protein n=1 Tax=Amniculicola lignicola CBS 123094 TaxID=1392246 RepID=A0A6A5WU85_9PLEO|nr:hypothetical protein P154DRAFT_457349 [Amniculicola lignicola CBS 123094]
MATIRLATAVNIRNFQELSAALSDGDSKYSHLVDPVALEDEFGRLRVWAGNLGALQKGHSSLDYRLRDSPLLSSNALKFLGELETNLSEATAVITGARLPYEEQAKLKQSAADDDEDGFFSEDDEESDEGTPKTELENRILEVIDIIDNLYKLSIRIRTPTIRSRSLKAASYQPKTPEGVDIFGEYARFDEQYARELIRSLRAPNTDETPKDEDVLVDRLSKAITLRRRQFRYWRRHRDKLGISTILEEPISSAQPVLHRPEFLQRNDTLEAQAGNPVILELKAGASEKTRKTLLSGTEATHYHQSLDEIVDARSVTSYATTHRDITGRGIELPAPPKAADGEKDFECPYCFIICPSRYSTGRSWRTHLLQDMQPYICTYTDCEAPEQLYRSRREWSEHESTHRKAWRCPEHPNAVYRSPSGLQDHLRQQHSNSIAENELDSIVKVGETSTVDLRPKCPICFADADVEGGLQNHIANHLERFASFALPKDIDTADDESDGASSVASRGRSAVSGSSQDLSHVSFHSNRSSGNNEETISELEKISSLDSPSSRTTSGKNAGQGRLTLDMLKSIPERKDAMEMFSSTISDDIDEDELEQVLQNTGPIEGEEHIEDSEALRTYLLSFPGARSVRFFRRYGSWKGYIMLRNEDSAIQALTSFDASRFPQLRVRQAAGNKATLKFHVPAPDDKVPPVPYRGDDASVSSASLSSVDPNDDRLPLLPLSDVPTLRALYRTRKLRQRDQSYAPNDAYNQTVSFCFYDICQLQVEAFVNSANKAMRITKNSESLNHYVHQRAGREMKKELKVAGKVKPGQVRLSSGYALFAKYVIHAARPNYSGAYKGMGQFNILTECYRSALKVAMNKGIKTLAFPSLGAGGCGFPPRVSARIALQEVREFMDNHKGYKFERIVFCVFNGADEKAYKDFIPVFFPPTHGDLENITIEDALVSDPLVLARDIEEVEVQTETLTQELVEFGSHVQDFPQSVITELAATNSSLVALRTLFMGSNFPGNSLNSLSGKTISDIHLLCGSLTIACGSVTEMIEESKSSLEPDYNQIWKSYIFHTASAHGMNLNSLMELFRDFASCLEDYLVRGGIESAEMGNMRTRIANYRLKVTGEGHGSSRELFDEVMYTRQFQRESNAPPRTDTIKIHQIPSVSRLYQVGKLEEKPTQSIPNSRLNYTVGFIRGDITSLEVDAIVNSTDIGFSGMGTLDRTIFRKGGPRLEEDCNNFGVCDEGDVKVTPGYALPAKHVIHVIPPESYRRDSKQVLRKLFREILFMASSLKATSIAIPCIGTGMLNYPVQELAALSMEEVKRYLETLEPTNTLERVIFCVYGSNDEQVYQALLPIYFPPLNMNVNKALPAGSGSPVSESSSTEGLAAGTTASRPKRTLFGSISDAFRSVRFGKQPVTQTSRPPNLSERHALENFEAHAHDCPTKACENIARTYAENGELCRAGHSVAAELLQCLYMEEDRSVYALTPENGQRVRIEVPQNYPMSWNLLIAVERSYRDPHRTRPFVNNQPYKSNLGQEYETQEPSEIPPGVTIHHADVEVRVRREAEKSIAIVAVWSESQQKWERLQEYEASVHVLPGRVLVYETDFSTVDQTPLHSMDLTPLSHIKKQVSTEVVVTARELRGSRIVTHPDIMFQLRSPAQCEMLFQTLRHARMNNPDYIIPRGEHATDRLIKISEQGALRGTMAADASIQDGAVANPPVRGGRSGIAVTLARVSNTDNLWKNVVDDQCVAYASNGELQVFEEGAETTDPAPLLALDLTPVTPITRTSTRRIEIRSDPLEGSRANTEGSVQFSLRCKDDADCAALFDAITTAKKAHPLYHVVYEDLQSPDAVVEQSDVQAETRSSSTSIPPDTVVKESDVPDATDSGGPSTHIPEEDFGVRKFDASIAGLSLVNINEYFSYLDILVDSGPESTSSAPKVRPIEIPSASKQVSEPTESPTVFERDDKDMGDQPLDVHHPRPPTPDLSHPDAGSIPRNARWTKIDRRLVNSQALEEANERFEYGEESVIVLRVLTKEEILKLAERTRDIRRGKEELKEWAKKVGKGEAVLGQEGGDGAAVTRSGLAAMFSENKELEGKNDDGVGKTS